MDAYHSTDDGVCPNCGRDGSQVQLTRHHLVPKSRGGRRGDTLTLCVDCHTFLNTQYTPAEQEQLSQPERLLADPRMRRFGRFASRQRGGIKHRESRQRRSRRRR